MSSKFLVVICLFLVLNVCNLTANESLDYTVLETLSATCPPGDACYRRPLNLPFENRSCECDDQCHSFGDCCIDVVPEEAERIQGLECMDYKNDTTGVYVVSRCKSYWRGSNEIRKKCENIVDMSDPLAAAPATDTANDITYKNRYCAQCNWANAKNLHSWSISVQCPDVPLDAGNQNLVNSSYVESHLTYITSGNNANNWGFFYPNLEQPTTAREFFRCDIPFRLPDALEDHVRYCKPNLVASCARSWGRQAVRNLCAIYTAVIYVNVTPYRNPHCALCNSKYLGNMVCQRPPRISVDGRKKKPALSFTMLLDVNMSDGNRVGEVRDDRCSTGQQWDPFFKKCRTLVCVIPGYIMQNRRCVKP